MTQVSKQISQDVSIGEDKEIVVSQPQKLSYNEAVVILTDLAGEDSQYEDIVSNV